MSLMRMAKDLENMAFNLRSLAVGQSDPPKLRSVEVSVGHHPSPATATIRMAHVIPGDSVANVADDLHAIHLRRPVGSPSEDVDDIIARLRGLALEGFYTGALGEPYRLKACLPNDALEEIARNLDILAKQPGFGTPEWYKSAAARLRTFIGNSGTELTNKYREGFVAGEQHARSGGRK